MIINAVTFEPQDTGMSEEELGAVRELLGNELMQKFCIAQEQAILKWSAREADPYRADVTDAQYRAGMQRIHAIASIWRQIADATESQGA